MNGQIAPSSRRALAVPALRALVGDLDFTIVSNNCWGAHIYQALDLEYATPFVGLFIPPDSYLALLRRFDELMEADLIFTAKSRSASVNAWRDGAGLTYPIALLGGEVEVNFQHYASPEEARDKWRRRAARMTRDPARLFFKFDDREGATAAQIAEFEGLPLANKVCFTASAHEVPTVRAPAEEGQPWVIDGLSLAGVSRRYFNTLRWISSHPRWWPTPSLL
jgi:uncharacterized protein (DUF1919 family)